MHYPRLGTTGLKVSKLAVGGARFGEIDDRTAAELVSLAIDSGVSTFDTADTYNAGASESQLGPLLKKHRDRVVLCTKVGLRVGDSDTDYLNRGDDAARWKRGIGPNDDGLSRKHIMSAIDASLRRLQTDYVDLYQVHRFDPDTPIEETLETLADLVTSGKVRYVGCSGFAAAQLGEALRASESRGLPRMASIQSAYSLVVRNGESALYPLCVDEHVGVFAFSVVAGGMLSGRFSRGVEPGPETRLGTRQAFRHMYMTDDNFALVENLEKAARDTGRSSAQLATGWVAAQPHVTSVLVGFSAPSQLEEMVKVMDDPLLPEELQKVEDAAAG
ncbi:MAG: aldo/keto reductase [Acidimicrobiales bacterium]|nr:aldo/keto reductase [Acidimicrobiales bacterium]